MTRGRGATETRRGGQHAEKKAGTAFDPFDRLPGTMPGTDRAGRLRDSGRQ